MSIDGTFGSGGTYAGLTELWTYLRSIDPLSSDYHFRQVGGCNVSSWPDPRLLFNGHKVKIDCAWQDSHQGKDQGYKITVNNSTVVAMRADSPTGNDELILENLYFDKTDGTDVNLLFVGGWATGGSIVRLNNLICKGTSTTIARGIRFGQNDTEIYLSNIILKLFLQGLNDQITGSAAEHTAENITAEECGGGFGFGAAWDLRNLVAINATTQGFGSMALCSLYNCADDDNTIVSVAVASGATSTDCLANITPANEFKSQTFGNDDYLDLKTNGQLANLGAAPAIADNYRGIRGRPRPHTIYGQGEKYSIGAVEVFGDRGDRRHEIAMRKIWPVKILLNEDSEAGI